MKHEFTTDKGWGSHRAGLIVLQSDETMENELRGLFGPEFALYHSRIPSHPHVTRETLASMAADLPQAAAQLPPDLGVVGYGCTSGATVIGPDVVAGLVHRSHPKTPVTNPITAVIAGLTALGVRRLAMVTPYVPEVSHAMRDLLAQTGFEITGITSFEEGNEATVARITEGSTLEAIKAAARACDCDAVFASCTNLRTFGIIAAAEAALDMPVISSNLALAWHMQRLAGVGPDHSASRPARLFGH